MYSVRCMHRSIRSIAFVYIFIFVEKFRSIFKYPTIKIINELVMETENRYGECRCCLARGNHRDILKEYFFNGSREVYIEILKDTFNLLLSKCLNLTMLICDTCVTRLRDASSFRTMVSDTQQQLLEVLNKQTIFVNVPTERLSDVEVKTEAVAVKLEAEDDFESEHNYDSDYILADDLIAEAVKPPKLYKSIRGEAALLGRFRRIKPLPTRETLANTCANYVRHLDLLKHVTMTPNMISLLQLEDEDSPRRSSAISEKSAHVTNATILLKYSNITPFKSRCRSGYPCFYCRSIFEDFDKLRQHSLDHKTSEIPRVLKHFGPESLIVYVDVSDLKCKLCSKDIPNINELKTHLIKIHNKKIITDITDRVIPFKLNGNMFVCQTCDCKFETFGSIERHMNGHYRNYVCKECGSGYVTKYRLKVHHKSMHVGGNFPCEECGKMFSTQQKHKNHVNTVHKMIKRFKCAKCPERFGEYFRRQKHMVDIHGVAPLKYTCNVCDRSFDRRYTLSRHLKRDHLEERENECDVCSYKCHTKNELKVHMIKHTGERIYECAVCKKSYARKKTLKEHMRIHNNDRRFVCPVCGQAFVQKCSLKGHMKTHHFEYNMP